ncbi:hypothetical protein [Aristophania vespae]|uniref:hypothetical protein n=1 Tax=Aristophania vespae TaxID=2697033 RepID=UPI0023514B52|nr:hypothetical protein [Aristophania vespae]UMM63100.1 hypothetical protein DM15PD_00540 [Aristophania vespae]
MSQERRRRQLQKKGRLFQLSRANKSPFNVLGYGTPPTTVTLNNAAPSQLFLVQIGHAEIEQAPDYDHPRNGDKLIDGPKKYTLTDASPIYKKDQLIGWVLIAKGGT